MNKYNRKNIGYKNTKIGWIPEDWDLQPLDNLGIFLKGSGISKNELKENGFPCIRYGELYTHHNFYVKKFYSFIDLPTAQNSQSIKKGDILFAGSGETLAEIGKCVAFLDDTKAYAGGDIIIFRSNYNNAKFFGFLLNQEIINKQKYKLGQGHSVVHIYSNNLKKILIPLPPLPEQKKIAEILSTWDESIEKTQKLIQAKERRKKGLMQQLLTGKKRLPGFNGKWERIKMSNIFERVRRINEKPNEKKEILTISAKYGFLSQEFKFNKVIAGSSLKKYTLLYKDEFAYNKGNSKTYPYGCIYKMNNPEGLVPFVYICFRAFQEINYNFYQFYFAHGLLEPQLKEIITSGARGDGLLNVAIEDFFKLKILLPPIKEQNAIAAVLSTADEEISLRKRKLEALKEQKKGLMQKLLTGEVRVKT